MKYKRLYKDEEYPDTRKVLAEYSLKDIAQRMEKPNLSKAPRKVVEDNFIQYSLEEITRQKARRILQAGLDSGILEIGYRDKYGNPY